MSGTNREVPDADCSGDPNYGAVIVLQERGWAGRAGITDLGGTLRAAQFKTGVGAGHSSIGVLGPPHLSAAGDTEMSPPAIWPTSAISQVGTTPHTEDTGSIMPRRATTFVLGPHARAPAIGGIACILADRWAWTPWGRRWSPSRRENATVTVTGTTSPNQWQGTA